MLKKISTWSLTTLEYRIIFYSDEKQPQYCFPALSFSFTSSLIHNVLITTICTYVILTVSFTVAFRGCVHCNMNNNPFIYKACITTCKTIIQIMPLGECRPPWTKMVHSLSSLMVVSSKLGRRPSGFSVFRSSTSFCKSTKMPAIRCVLVLYVFA